MGVVSGLLEVARAHSSNRYRCLSSDMGIRVFAVCDVRWFADTVEGLATVVGVGPKYSQSKDPSAADGCFGFDRHQLVGIRDCDLERANFGCQCRILHMPASGRAVGSVVSKRATVEDAMDRVCFDFGGRPHDGRVGLRFPLAGLGRSVFVRVLCADKKTHRMLGDDEPNVRNGDFVFTCVGVSVVPRLLVFDWDCSRIHV